LGKYESLELWCKEAENLLVAEEHEEYVKLWEKLAAGVVSGDFISIDQSVTRQLRSLFSFNSDIAGSFEEIEKDITSLRPIRVMPRPISDDLYEARYYVRKWRGWGHAERDSSGSWYFKFGSEMQKLDFIACMNCFMKWIKGLSKKQLLFLDSEGQVVEKPFRTRFTDNGRKAHLRMVYEDACAAGVLNFKKATFITLTTNPENFSSMDEANKAMGGNFNRFIAYIRKHFKKKSDQMPYINVREFQNNGRLHMHVILFGVSLQQDVNDIKRKIFTNSLVEKAWIRYGQGSVTNSQPLNWMDDKQTIWWGNRTHKPSDCKTGDGPLDYLKKYLRKVLSGNDDNVESFPDYNSLIEFLDVNGDEEFPEDGVIAALHNAKSTFQYWANSCRFYTKSQSLVTEEFAKTLLMWKIKINILRRKFPLTMVGIRNTASNIIYVSNTINSKIFKDPGDLI
jgi:Protein of unknown function (DUF3296).